RYADLRRQMRPPRGPGLIGDIDTLIAATAIERKLTLVTADTDFQRVPGLHGRARTSIGASSVASRAHQAPPPFIGKEHGWPNRWKFESWEHRKHPREPGIQACR